MTYEGLKFTDKLWEGVMIALIDDDMEHVIDDSTTLADLRGAARTVADKVQEVLVAWEESQ